MKIIEFIRKIFRKNKVKLLQESYENTEEKEVSIKNNNEVLTFEKYKNHEKNEISKSEKVVLLLKSVGCDNSIFDSDYDFEDLDLKNMKDNLMFLTNFGFTKLEMDIILR